jgi:uncharacterized membrane protein (UPF0127 family)
MSVVRVINESRRRVLGGNIRMADTLAARLRGFLFRRQPAAGEGLFLAPCKGVHMYGMRFPLDILFIDQAGLVVAAHPGLAPGQRTPVYRSAMYALELPSGAIADTGTAVGDRLSWKPTTGATTDLINVVHRLRAHATNGRTA